MATGGGGGIRRTVRRALEYETAKRKGSRFITGVWPLDVPGEAAHAHVKALIDGQRAKFPDACHHCYGYTTMDGREQCSDDGEPHGTAGKPILVAIQRAQLADVCVVVSRIFGGTKLGTGGLIRAYGAAAQEALEQADVVEKVPTSLLRVGASMSLVDVVKQASAKFGAEFASQEFGMEASFVVRVPLASTDVFAGFLRAKSAGKIRVEQVE